MSKLLYCLCSLLILCDCLHCYHSNQDCILFVHEDEDPVLEGIVDYPIMLLSFNCLKNLTSELFCLNSWHYYKGPWDCPNMNLTTDIPREDELTNLQGNSLRVTIVENPPMTYFSGPKKIGYFVDILNILADLMHFKVVYQMPPDGLWGVINKDGTWNGMVGELVSNQCDISIGALSITEDRSKVIDFTHSLADDVMTLNYRLRRTVDFEFQAFSQVFQSNTWTTIAIFSLLMVIGLCLTSQMGPNKLGFLRSFEIIWFNFILRDPDGHDHLFSPSSLFSYKICFAIMSWFSLIVMTVYTGDLTSKMTDSGKVDDLTSFQDLIDRNWQLVIYPGTSVYDKVAQSPDGSALKNLFQNHLFQNELKLNLTDVILNNWNVAHLGSKNTFLDQPDIHSVSVPGAWSEPVAFGVPKHWPHLKTMNHHIQRLREFGILSILKSKWFKTQPSNAIGSQNESFSISYQHSLFPFALLLLFCCVSLVLGGLERIFSKPQYLHEGSGPKQSGCF